MNASNSKLRTQHPALFVTDVLRANLPRVLYVQGLVELEEPPLIALAQFLLHTLVSFMKPFLGIVADPVDARVFSPDSPHQLTLLGVGPLPLPATRLAGIAILISASAWVSPLHSRPGRPGVRGGATRCAVCSMAVVKAVSTSTTLLPLGVNVLSCSPITVATS